MVDKEDYIEAQLRLLDKRLACVEKAIKKPIALSTAAKLMGKSREVLRRRIQEAIANPKKSSLIEGVHFEKFGHNWQVLDFEEFKKALLENDIKFNRKR